MNAQRGGSKSKVQPKYDGKSKSLAWVDWFDDLWEGTEEIPCIGTVEIIHVPHDLKHLN